jgi:predicted site-specific integrase-resolvase
MENHISIGKAAKYLGVSINTLRVWEKKKMLLEAVKETNNALVIIEHKDRLARFGYAYLEKYISDFGGHIVVIEKKLSKVIESEVTASEDNGDGDNPGTDS